MEKTYKKLIASLLSIFLMSLIMGCIYVLFALLALFVEESFRQDSVGMYVTTIFMFLSAIFMFEMMSRSDRIDEEEEHKTAIQYLVFTLVLSLLLYMVSIPVYKLFY